MQNQITLILKSWNLLKPFHKWFYFNVILAFTLSGISVTLTFLGSKILNSIATHDTARVIELFITLFSLEIVWNIFSFIRSRNTSVYLDQKIAQYLQEHSFKKILNLTIEQHIEDHSAIKPTRYGRDFYSCTRYPKCNWASWNKPNPGDRVTAEQWKVIQAEREARKKAKEDAAAASGKSPAKAKTATKSKAKKSTKKTKK
jgi:ssDNA-binding Zn-finger/Zn-ribbon topoisomerase 1